MKTMMTDRSRNMIRNEAPKRPPRSSDRDRTEFSAEEAALNAWENQWNRKLEDARHIVRIRTVLLNIGILPHYDGYRFLSDAIDLGYRRPETLKRVTKWVYPAVAKKRRTTAWNVEHSIRRALDRACQSGGIENLDNLLRVDAFAGVQKMHTKDFLLLVADLLRSEYGPYSETSDSSEPSDDTNSAEFST